jgi:hypothetical protein
MAETTRYTIILNKDQLYKIRKAAEKRNVVTSVLIRQWLELGLASIESGVTLELKKNGETVYKA